MPRRSVGHLWAGRRRATCPRARGPGQPAAGGTGQGTRGTTAPRTRHSLTTGTAGIFLNTSRPATTVRRLSQRRTTWAVATALAIATSSTRAVIARVPAAGLIAVGAVV